MISIIVPIFKGQEYIPALIEQAEKNQDLLGNIDKIELVLSNDNPYEVIEASNSKKINILILNTEINRGIQGARIAGLKVACGDYIVFLDQDDYIEPEFCISQLQEIKNADCVVCRCIHENKPYYNMDNPFEKMMNLEYMISHGDSIISPGQVMIRKDAIPKVWTDNIMTKNGADDFLLWLAMLAEGKMFALNDRILYCHTVDGDNASWNAVKQLESEKQMIDILEKNNILSSEQTSRLWETILTKRTAILGKFRKLFFNLNKMLELKERGYSLEDFVLKNQYKRIAIYGAGYLGKRILGELKDLEISLFYIDRNAEYLEKYIDVPIFSIDDTPDDMDLIIVSLVENYDSLVKTLEKTFSARVIQLSELFNSMEYSE